MLDDLYSSKNNLQDKYRLVVMNDDTFEEVTSYRLTRLNAYLAIGAVLFGAFLIGWLLLAFTPLRRTLPGDYINPREVMALQDKIDTLESMIQAQSAVIASRERWLSGDYELGPGEYVEAEQADIKPIEPIAEDLALRKKYGDEPAEEEVAVVEETEESKEEEEDKEEVAEGKISDDLIDEVPEEATDEPPKVNVKPPKPVLVATNHNGMAKEYIVPPISGGRVTAEFDSEKKHYGTDITAPRNTPVLSILSGTVISSDETIDTGNVIAIQHEHNLVSFYKHNSVLLKKVGSFVSKGEAIAIIGNTGEMSDGPHLHFELWQNGKPVDPKDFIDF